MNIGEHNMFDNQMGMPGEFQLEEGPLVDDNVQPVQESSDEELSEM